MTKEMKRKGNVWKAGSKETSGSSSGRGRGGRGRSSSGRGRGSSTADEPLYNEGNDFFDFD